MIRSEAVTLVMQRLGKRTGLETDIIAELQQAQNDLESGEFLPWFLKKAHSGLVTVANARAVALPGDFLRETEEKLWITTTDGARRLIKGDYEDLYSREVFNAEYLSSNYYAMVGTSMYLFPTPASAMAISGFYFAADAVLTTDAANNWLTYASGAMIGKAGMRMAKTLRDSDAYSIFKEDFAEAYGKLINANTAREQAALNAIMGG